MVVTEMTWPAKPKLFTICPSESLLTPGIDHCWHMTWLTIPLLYFKGLHARFEIQPGDACLFINGLRVDMSAYDPFR